MLAQRGRFLQNAQFLAIALGISALQLTHGAIPERSGYAGSFTKRGLGSPGKGVTDVPEIVIHPVDSSNAMASAPPLPAGSLAGLKSSSSPSSVSGSPQSPDCLDCLAPKHPVNHCTRVLGHTQDAIEHLVLTVLSLPVHVALGIGGAMWCPVAAIGSAWEGRFRDASEYAGLTIAKPAVGAVGGVVVGLASLGLSLGNICCALYHIAALPFASCRRVFHGRPNEQEWRECHDDIERFKEKQRIMSDKIDLWNENLADFSLYSGPKARIL